MDKNDKRRNRIIIIIIIILLLLIIAVMGFFLLRKGNSAPAGGGVTLSLDKNAGEYVEKPKDASSGEKTEAKKGVAIPGWGAITLPAGVKEADSVDFYNPDANKDLYYLTFEILIPDDKGEYESVAKTGLIEPGLHVQHIELERELEAGEYEAVIHVQPYRIEDMTTTNNADLKTKLTVK